MPLEVGFHLRLNYFVLSPSSQRINSLDYYWVSVTAKTSNALVLYYTNSLLINLVFITRFTTSELFPGIIKYFKGPYVFIC